VTVPVAYSHVMENTYVQVCYGQLCDLYESNNPYGRAVNAYMALCYSNTKIADSSPVRR
jgi:hypothetical protein